MELERYVPVIIVLSFVGGFAVLGLILWQQKYHPRFPDPAAELAGTGLPAQAVILEAQHVTLIGMNELTIAFVLEVRAEGRPPYRAKCFKKVSLLELHRYDVGARVKVLVDPKDPSRVGIVGSEQRDVEGSPLTK
jgi:hypothetical protein